MGAAIGFPPMRCSNMAAGLVAELANHSTCFPGLSRSFLGLLFFRVRIYDAHIKRTLDSDTSRKRPAVIGQQFRCHIITRVKKTETLLGFSTIAQSRRRRLGFYV